MHGRGERTGMVQDDADLMTAEEFALTPYDHAELVRGRVVVHEPPTMYHGFVASQLIYRLAAFVEPRRLGWVVSEAGFKVQSSPDTVRAPDVAYIARGPGVELTRRGFPPRAPDIAAEVLSPDDRPGEVVAKVADWLQGGAQLVWVIDPRRETATIYHADGTMAIAPRSGALDGETVLPGFSCPLADLFDMDGASA